MVNTQAEEGQKLLLAPMAQTRDIGFGFGHVARGIALTGRIPNRGCVGFVLDFWVSKKSDTLGPTAVRVQFSRAPVKRFIYSP